MDVGGRVDRWTKFRPQRPVLHGIDRADIPLVIALEFAILLGYDGQLKQNSEMEKELFQSGIDQLKKTKMAKIENALIWLYVKTWGLQGQHVIDEDALWNFGIEDLESALNTIVYPRKKKKNDEKSEGEISLIEELRNRIMQKFDDDKVKFYEWSQTVYDEVRLYYIGYTSTRFNTCNMSPTFIKNQNYISVSRSKSQFRDPCCKQNQWTNFNCKE